MYIRNEDDALNLISQGAKYFRIQLELDFISRLQLYMTGRITMGVEIYGVGAIDLRGLHFLIQYHCIINDAKKNHYRIFIIKEGSYFGSGDWSLDFKKTEQADPINV